MAVSLCVCLTLLCAHRANVYCHSHSISGLLHEIGERALPDISTLPLKKKIFNTEQQHELFEGGEKTKQNETKEEEMKIGAEQCTGVTPGSLEI